MLPALIDLWGIFECVWDIGVRELFLVSFLQEPTFLHGWIEHALLPPDYMDLSGIYINSSSAARVCTILQMKNAAHNSQRYRFVRRGEEMMKGRRVRTLITFLTVWRRQTDNNMSMSLLLSLTWSLSAEKAKLMILVNHFTKAGFCALSPLKLLINVPL